MNKFCKNAEDKKIIKLAKEFLKMENPDNEILKKLVKRIEFDKNKNIKVELTFAKKSIEFRTKEYT